MQRVRLISVKHKTMEKSLTKEYLIIFYRKRSGINQAQRLKFLKKIRKSQKTRHAISQNVMLKIVWHIIILFQLKPFPERFGIMMSQSGVAITITSVTDVVAFAVGSASILPGNVNVEVVVDVIKHMLNQDLLQNWNIKNMVLQFLFTCFSYLVCIRVS